MDPQYARYDATTCRCGVEIEGLAAEFSAPSLFAFAGTLLAIHNKIVGKAGEGRHDDGLDLEVEYAIVRALLARWGPSLLVIGEEATAHGRTSAYAGERVVWLDPIDGSRLLAEGRPDYAMTFAVSISGALAASVIALPGTGDRYVAVRGGGLFKNMERLGPSRRDPPKPLVAMRRRDHRDADRIFAAVAAAGFEAQRMESTARRFVELAEGRISGLVKRVGRVGSVPRLWGLAAGLLACGERGYPLWFDRRERLLAVGEAFFIEALRAGGADGLRRTCLTRLWSLLSAPGPDG